MREPPRAAFTRPFEAACAGRITRIDNRRLARVAKLAGAPRDPAAGLELHVRLDTWVEPGQPLFTVHAESEGQIEYALAYAAGREPILMVAGTA
jgi:thymidine phosphorylase